MNLAEGILTLFLLCENSGIGLTLDYDNGRYIPGEFTDKYDPLKNPPEEYIRQGPKGWTIDVGGWGTDELQDLDDAIVTGFQILKEKFLDGEDEEN